MMQASPELPGGYGPLGSPFLCFQASGAMSALCVARCSALWCREAPLVTSQLQNDDDRAREMQAVGLNGLQCRAIGSCRSKCVGTRVVDIGRGCHKEVLNKEVGVDDCKPSGGPSRSALVGGLAHRFASSPGERPCMHEWLRGSSVGPPARPASGRAGMSMGMQTVIQHQVVAQLVLRVQGLAAHAPACR